MLNRIGYLPEDVVHGALRMRMGWCEHNPTIQRRIANPAPAATRAEKARGIDSALEQKRMGGGVGQWSTSEDKTPRTKTKKCRKAEEKLNVYPYPKVFSQKGSGEGAPEGGGDKSNACSYGL